jgi:Gas vesicle synthesis protein GvpO
MAERRSKSSSGSNGSLSASEAIKRVRRELPQLLGRPIESVLGVERGEDEEWKVTVAVVELSRIPSTTDVLGAYAVTLDHSGELIGYSRSRRYHRNQADED